MDSTSSKSHIILLGAGPAGLGAAFKLAQSGHYRVTILEQNDRVGGNAGSFELSGIRVDYGSHRLHPTSHTEIIQDIREMIGKDLLDRPRHGRILLHGHWIHFPLKPLDLLLKLPPKFAIGVLTDWAKKIILRKQDTSDNESFASVMERGLGQTICQDFYFPYAQKIWGQDVHLLSAIQARRRVSAGSLPKLMKKVISSIPGFKPKGSGRFFYPRRGFGQISEAYCQAAEKNGANLVLNARVKQITYRAENDVLVKYEQGGIENELFANYVWSTIPITLLARLMNPSPPAEIMDAIGSIGYRAMLLIYLVLNQNQFSEYDAHYFPNRDIQITRLSEPKNYAALNEPDSRTVLCAELPCSLDDVVWGMNDEQLGGLVSDALNKAGIPLTSTVDEIFVRRLRFAYPIYKIGYETYFDRLDEWIGSFESLLTFGRQGLFAHDNTHHALFMAYSAVKCFRSDGSFDRSLWHDYRKVFETHVVED